MKRWLVLTVVMASALASRSTAAQDANLVALETGGRQVRGVESSLDRLAQLDLERASPVDALVALRDGSGIRILFSPSLLPARPLVTCRCVDVTVREALERILADTGFHFSEVGDQVLIERGSEPVPGARLVFPAAPAPSVDALVRRTSLHGSARSARANGLIIGQVVETDSQRPLDGVQVSVVGTTIGARTDDEGRYTLSGVPAGDRTVRAELIGYGAIERTVAVAADEASVLDFELVAQALALDPVVVTALGLEREARSLGTAVQQVRGAEIERAGEANLVSALAGRAAGVQILSSGGRPGASSRIVIRGESSFLGNNQPLFVVDGVPVSNAVDELGGPFVLERGNPSNRLLDLDPNTIENITILRGASATALYGSQAAHGAVVVTTRRGTGAPQMTFSTRAQVDRAILDGFQSSYLQGLDGYYTNGQPLDRGGYLQPGFPGQSPQVMEHWGPHKDHVTSEVLQDLGTESIPARDPRRAFYRNARTVENSLRIAGTLAAGSYFFSIAHLDQGGISPGTALERLSVTANFSTSLGSRLTSATNVYYGNTSNEWLREGWSGVSRYLTLTPLSFNHDEPYLEDGTPRMLAWYLPNSHWFADNTGYDSDVRRLVGSQHFELLLRPGLSLSNRIGLDTYVDERTERRNYEPWIWDQRTGSVYRETLNRTSVNNDLMLSLDRMRLGDRFAFSAMVGANVNMSDFGYVRLFGTEMNIPDFYHVSNFNTVTGDEFVSRRRVAGLYSQATLDYRNWLYLSLTGRNDWSSTLPVDNNSYFYPSASLSVIFTDALDLPLNGFLDQGKLRLSWARVGSDAAPYSLSTSYTRTEYTDFAGTGITLRYPFNNVNAYTLGANLGNPELRPEMSNEAEVGLELIGLDGRATAEISFYDRVSRDQIFWAPASASTGHSNILRNAGDLRNQGLEVSLGGTPLTRGRFGWDLRANFSRNRSRVVELASGVESIYLAGYAWPQIRIMEDEGYGVIWGFGYQRDEHGRLLIGDNGMPLVSDQLGNLGNIQSDWLGNLSTTLRFGSVSLSGLLEVRRGGDVLNYDLNYTIPIGMAKVTEHRDDEIVFDGINATTGEPNTVSVVRDRAFWREYGLVHENQIEDGSFIRLRELSISAPLPRRLLGSRVRSAVVTATGRNLWVDTDFSYGDPEASTYGAGNSGGHAFHFFPTPQTRSVSVGLQVSF